MNKKDFSKNCLSQALVELLEDHEYEDISIQDIVDRAGFSRMAYYRNFKNKNEVVEYYVHNYFEVFVKNTQISYMRMGPEKFFLTLFEFLAAKDTNKMSQLLIKRGLIGHLYVEFIKRAQGGFLPGQSEYFYDFIAGGIFAVFVGWLNNGYKESPEEMVSEAMNFIKVVNKDTNPQ